jgi:hypothetical protein
LWPAWSSGSSTISVANPSRSLGIPHPADATANLWQTSSSKTAILRSPSVLPSRDSRKIEGSRLSLSAAAAKQVHGP